MKNLLWACGPLLLLLLAAWNFGCGDPIPVALPEPETATARMGGSDVVSAGLTTGEAEDLLYIFEEEKLARDIYVEMFEQWGLTIFENISLSEQNHMNAVWTLIDRYGLTDAIEEKPAGEFTDQNLQALYDQLLARGITLPEEALLVGVEIEETDITDLKEAIEVSEHRDIDRVYGNLLRASENHLEKFTRHVEPG